MWQMSTRVSAIRAGHCRRSKLVEVTSATTNCVELRCRSQISTASYGAARKPAAADILMLAALPAARFTPLQPNRILYARSDLHRLCADRRRRHPGRRGAYRRTLIRYAAYRGVGTAGRRG